MPESQIINITVIILILAGLTVHRYLSFTWETGELPYPAGFTAIANLFALVYLAGFIWMFGIIWGIILSLLCFFQIVYSAGLWVFTLPALIRWINSTGAAQKPLANPYIYAGFSFLALITGILTAVNFFISPYKSVLGLIDGDPWKPVLIFFGVIIAGNIARVVVMSKL